MNTTTVIDHSAEHAALGFYYQTFYALRVLLDQPHDDATVCIETLDDVEVCSNGQTLLNQLKHSMSATPAPVTLASSALWRTLKVWIDVLPHIVVPETRFQLVTVAPLGGAPELQVLLDEKADRKPLREALANEADCVVDEHRTARASDTRPFRHRDRIKACEAFLALPEPDQLKLLERTCVSASESCIVDIESDIAAKLDLFPADKRGAIARRLIGWWDIQVIHTLCGVRDRSICKTEVLNEIASIAGEIERDELVPEFETLIPPPEHQADSMLIKQISLVGGDEADIEVAMTCPLQTGPAGV
ncbi:hypothetical protein [Burkholderia pseudomallei]|uniref:hypothetical protein n=1 Tax=Burkholderia pseudomallei TaxID=28450 RepID=UPI0029490794|nr:hypothetical protein [Burkholderia pseudomallei]CAJ9865375.1 Uncharacterised protein [Burkholderia pseudomallei]